MPERQVDTSLTVRNGTEGEPDRGDRLQGGGCRGIRLVLTRSSPEEAGHGHPQQSNQGDRSHQRESGCIYL